MSKVTVSWYCGMFVGPPKWHGDYYEPDECSTEFETQESLEDWEEECCVATCPECGAELTQAYDCPEVQCKEDPEP